MLGMGNRNPGEGDGGQDQKDKPPQNDPTVSPPKETRGGIVQLTSNQGDHQVGETFKAADAKKLGIDKHCVSFEA